jgi:hypothetical protein
MPYRADFYVPENIIGYTGVLNKNPTVYFLSPTEYGHITQVHDADSNVGREEVCKNAQYIFGNDGGRLVERDPARPMKHTSRSPIILIEDVVPPELTHAIMVHPERKIHRLSKDKKTDAELIESDKRSTVANLLRANNKYEGIAPTDQERKAQIGPNFRWTRTENNAPAQTRLARV